MHMWQFNLYLFIQLLFIINSLNVFKYTIDAVTNFKFVPLNTIDVGSNLSGEKFLLFFFIKFDFSIDLSTYCIVILWKYIIYLQFFDDCVLVLLLLLQIKQILYPNVTYINHFNQSFQVPDDCIKKSTESREVGQCRRTSWRGESTKHNLHLNM